MWYPRWHEQKKIIIQKFWFQKSARKQQRLLSSNLTLKITRTNQNIIRKERGERSSIRARSIAGNDGELGNSWKLYDDARKNQANKANTEGIWQ